ncbi:NAD(P)/FAD-dependent oxidoreductase [Roseovarius sp. C7]|uniref:NAD(P)/FAD-dependent oxidoreductase n=1 Tax=Roseovarius sp. C7 TaxID=3398643 RepID=UPI0039F63CB9
MTRHIARRLPRQTGRAAWNAILPDAPPPRPLAADRTADVAIIGAGFAGLSAARRLLQIDPGLRIALLEAGRVGEGAAGRNSGFMINLPHDLQSDDYAGHAAESDRIMTRFNRAAIAFAAEAVADYGIAPAHFDPVGKVNGAAGDAAHAQNLSYARHLEALGEPCEMLDAQSMQALTGSRYYQSGLYTPGTAILQPAGYIRGLAKGLMARGVDIYEASPVTALDRQGGDWSVTANGQRLTAGRVILCTNGHLESFGFAKKRLMHVILFASMTEDLSSEALTALGGKPRWGITPSDPMGTTMRRIDTDQGGNRIVTRSCTEFRPGMEASRAGLARATRVMADKFAARFPQLAGVRQEHVWAGHLCLSLNGVSVTGALEDGLFSACVQNGLGTARGTLTGIAAAEAALATPSDICRHFTAEPAPKRLPPEPFATLGANMVLRLREHRARRE